MAERNLLGVLPENWWKPLALVLLGGTIGVGGTGASGVFNGKGVVKLEQRLDSADIERKLHADRITKLEAAMDWIRADLTAIRSSYEALDRKLDRVIERKAIP